MHELAKQPSASLPLIGLANPEGTPRAERRHSGAPAPRDFAALKLVSAVLFQDAFWTKGILRTPLYRGTKGERGLGGPQRSIQRQLSGFILC